MADLYDSVTARDIPTNIPGVAGYGDGVYAWSRADWDRFITKIKVVVAVTASWNGGHVLDCETGDATPSECPGWIRMRQAAGLRQPAIYCNLSTMAAVRAACYAAGLRIGIDYSLWIAHYTGSPHVVTGASAVQYADPLTGSPGHYDLTSINQSTWLMSLGIVAPHAPQGEAPMGLDANDPVVQQLLKIANAARTPFGVTGSVIFLDATLELGQQHKFYVTAKGELLQLVYDERAQTWTPNSMYTGLEPRTDVSGVVADDLGQVILSARLADGRILEAVAPFGQGWTYVVQGNPDNR